MVFSVIVYLAFLSMERKRAIAIQKLAERMNAKVNAKAVPASSAVNITIKRTSVSEADDASSSSSDAVKVSYCQRAQNWIKDPSLGRTVFWQIFGVRIHISIYIMYMYFILF